MRRFVPFGSHWAMGIELPYSLAVVDAGALWSCGQCPLDMQAEAIAKGDLAAQTRLTAHFIREQFTPYGMAPAGIAKLVAYVVEDGRTSLADVADILSDELGAVPIVTAVGVPHFYYAGMMIEIDVYGTTEGTPTGRPVTVVPGATATVVSSGPLVHCRLQLEPNADGAAAVRSLAPQLEGAVTGLDRLLSARLYGDAARARDGQFDALAEALGTDGGRAVHASLPGGAAITADLVFHRGTGNDPAVAARLTEATNSVRLEVRKSGPFLMLAGRVATSGFAMPEATRRIMEAFASALTAEGLGFADVVKQQTHYVGGASAEDLYSNMRIRNGFYAKPGPASTGLAVHRLGDGQANIAIEVLALRRDG